jgi:hypothetical protein
MWDVTTHHSAGTGHWAVSRDRRSPLRSGGKEAAGMSVGANIAVVAAGAILAFAVRVQLAGVSVQAVGGVLMAVGVIGLVLRVRALMRQRELTAAQARSAPEAVLVRPGGGSRLSEGSDYWKSDAFPGNRW